MKKIRAFLAFFPPFKQLETFGNIVSGLKKMNPSTQIKWVDTQNIHCTLVFLGEISERDIARVNEGVGDIAKRRESFQIVVRSFSVFPDRNKPRVIYLQGEDESGRVKSLQKNIYSFLQSEGFRLDDRPWVCHFTLGRVRTGGISFRGIPVDESFLIDSIYLMRSDLTSDGPVYTELKKFTLKKGDGEQHS